jgi:hypothetical protein
MAGNSTTRICEACGQLWWSGRFLDPTIEADCELCGGRVVRRSEASIAEASVSAAKGRLDQAGAPR